MAVTGPSPFLSWRELACRDRRRTPYPAAFRTDPTRLPLLVAAFEALREAVGLPLAVLSAYRTPAHNRAVGGSPNSQHVQGRALDLKPPAGWTPARLADEARLVPEITGLGVYGTFVHIDVRPGPVARWFDAGHANGDVA